MHAIAVVAASTAIMAVMAAKHTALPGDGR